MIDKTLEKILNKLSTINPIDYLFENFFTLVFAIILIVFYRNIKNFIYNIIKKINKKTIKDDSIRTFINSVSNIILNIVMIIYILQLLGINLNGIYAIIGGLSLLLGFAFKESLSNLFGGIILLTFKPFKVGDEIEYNDYSGSIHKIEIYYTTMLNYQKEYIIIPNGNLIKNEIRNITKNNNRRLDLVIPIAYDADVEKVKSLILEILNNKNDLFNIEFEAPTIGIANLASDHIKLDVKVYVQKGKYLNSKYYFLENLKMIFKENGIEIPYNKLDVKILNER